MIFQTCPFPAIFGPFRRKKTSLSNGVAPLLFQALRLLLGKARDLCHPSRSQGLPDSGIQREQYHYGLSVTYGLLLPLLLGRSWHGRHVLCTAGMGCARLAWAVHGWRLCATAEHWLDPHHYHFPLTTELTILLFKRSINHFPLGHPPTTNGNNDQVGEDGLHLSRIGLWSQQ